MNFIIKRLLWSIPTLLAIVLVGFVLLVYTPGDPVKTVLHLSDSDDPLKPTSPNIEKQKREWEDKLGLNLPLFYFTIQSSALPDTLYKVTDIKEKKIIRNLCLTTGQTERVVELRNYIKILKKSWSSDLLSLPVGVRDSLNTEIEEITHIIQKLSTESNKTKVNEHISELNTKVQYLPFPNTDMVAEDWTNLLA